MPPFGLTYFNLKEQETGIAAAPTLASVFDWSPYQKKKEDPLWHFWQKMWDLEGVKRERLSQQALARKPLC